MRAHASMQALELKQNYALASILKGSLLLAERNFEAAPRFFLQANKIRKDIYSYRGERIKIRDGRKGRELDGVRV